ncbi:unnamed protein product [Discosporangium mesarthrocarpum]
MRSGTYPSEINCQGGGGDFLTAQGASAGSGGGSRHAPVLPARGPHGLQVLGWAGAEGQPVLGDRTLQTGGARSHRPGPSRSVLQLRGLSHTVRGGGEAEGFPAVPHWGVRGHRGHLHPPGSCE